MAYYSLTIEDMVKHDLGLYLWNEAFRLNRLKEGFAKGWGVFCSQWPV